MIPAVKGGFAASATCMIGTSSVFVKAISSGTTQVTVSGGGISNTASLIVDQSSSRPVEVVWVYPEEGATVSTNTRIEAVIGLKYCDCGMDVVDAPSKFYLDGVETSQAPIDINAVCVATLDIPQSAAPICFKPKTPLSPGTHEANFEATTVYIKREISCTWSFQVVE